MLNFLNLFSTKFSSGLVSAGDGGVTTFPQMVVSISGLSVMVFFTHVLEFTSAWGSRLGEILFPSGVRGTVSMLSFCSKGIVSPYWFLDSPTPSACSSLFTPSLSRVYKALKSCDSSWWSTILVWPEVLAVVDYSNDSSCSSACSDMFLVSWDALICSRTRAISSS